MNQEKFSKMSDQELLEVKQNHKPKPLVDAFFIGFLVGIVIYSILISSYGFLTLVPLVLIYVILKKPKDHAALEKELEKRNLN